MPPYAERSYRLLLVDAERKVLLSSPVDATDDAGGVAMATAMSRLIRIEGCACELYDGPRFVGRVRDPS